MNRNTTIVLVVIFAVLVLYVLTVQLPNERAAANVTPTPVASSSPVWTIAADHIAGVRVVDRVGNRSVAFAKDGQGIWSVTEPEAQPADQSLASTAAARFANLSATQTITTPTDLGAFGVLSPTYTVEVKLVDGTQLSMAIGDTAPTGSAYYVRRSGEANVLVLSSSAIDGIIALLDEPPYVVPTATAIVGPTVDFAATLFAPGATTAASATAPSSPAATRPSAATASPMP